MAAANIPQTPGRSARSLAVTDAADADRTGRHERALVTIVARLRTIRGEPLTNDELADLAEALAFHDRDEAAGRRDLDRHLGKLGVNEEEYRADLLARLLDLHDDPNG